MKEGSGQLFNPTSERSVQEIEVASCESNAGTSTFNEIKEEPNTLRILIAEDDYINFLVLQELLHSEKIEIIHAVNGKIAVDICIENKDLSLVLMDYLMPVMDGNTAAKMIKDLRPDLPIILQSAYLPENLENKGVVFDDYISKPIKPDLLRQKLTKYFSL